MIHSRARVDVFPKKNSPSENCSFTVGDVNPEKNTSSFSNSSSSEKNILNSLEIVSILLLSREQIKSLRRIDLLASFWIRQEIFNLSIFLQLRMTMRENNHAVVANRSPSIVGEVSGSLLIPLWSFHGRLVVVVELLLLLLKDLAASQTRIEVLGED